MHLIDTNVWLERLLDQKRTEEVKSFLDHVSTEHLFMTDLTYHSIGIILTRLDRDEALWRFTRDAFIDGAVTLLHLDPIEIQSVIQAMRRFNLDFDDAYQYVAAERWDLTIVSFDTDFDRTARGRKTPGEILREHTNQ
ncbi:MAG: PIN domain-containing protein [Anaerolineae bacterium]|nr:PIN domain-containing protein [Anaerolineae bacterium]